MNTRLLIILLLTNFIITPASAQSTAFPESIITVNPTNQ